MTFQLLASATALPLGLAAGWLGAARIRLFTAGLGRWGRRPARGVTPAWAFAGVTAAGAATLSLTYPLTDWPGWGGLMLLWCAALPLAWIDLRTQLIDVPWLVGALGLRLAWVGLFAREELLSMVLGMLLAAGFFHILDVVYETLRNRRGLGDGDPALAGLLGAFVGADGILPMVALAALTGLLGGGGWLVATRRGWSQPIPFGPFLVLAALVVMLARIHGWPVAPVWPAGLSAPWP